MRLLHKIEPTPPRSSSYLTDPDDIGQLKSFFAIPANTAIYARVTLVLVKPDYTSPERLKYPINHLRNLALYAATTSHVFVMDADFVPSPNLYRHARDTLLVDLPGSRRQAIVIPCYAIREDHKDDPLPTTMIELEELIDRGVAYITDPGSGHGPTLAVPMMTTGNTGGFWYEVCYESQWEPYYIVPRDSDNLVLYDARFRNQGGDKQSHALQLNAAGFQFLVSTETFILHKDHSKMVWPGGGFAESQKAYTHWSYFAEFMREMEDLYGANVRWPRACSATAIGWQVQQRSPIGVLMG
ncbi:glycosyl-transferase for dystroglycan-domain-containing protein [Dichotomocladium elegans]|nr:glycosyl-transferase for dystroglycan-domain-containing protein [Dichotomocladium elegans]